MGFLKKLFGAGAVAGTTVAAVKVEEKFKENNPDGVKDTNNDGKIDSQDYINEIKKAAQEVYDEAAASVKEKAPEVVEAAQKKIEEIKDQLN